MVKDRFAYLGIPLEYKWEMDNLAQRHFLYLQKGIKNGFAVPDNWKLAIY